MAVDLATLLKTAPFPEKQRQEILANMGRLNEDQKLRLSVAAWTALAQMYYSRLKYEKDKLTLEIQEHKREFNKKDFEEAEKRVLREFTQKLEKTETEEDIEEVREELQKHLRQPAEKPTSPPTPSPS